VGCVARLPDGTWRSYVMGIPFFRPTPFWAIFSTIGFLWWLQTDCSILEKILTRANLSNQTEH